MHTLPGKKYILWDHDGVLVDTEKWYFEATRKALSGLGIDVPADLYLDFMKDGKSLWTLASAKGIPAEVIRTQKATRNTYYREYLLNKNIEIPGVMETLEALSRKFSMAVVTTSKREDFELIHRGRYILKHMDFVLTVEDYSRAKPDPEPYLTALRRFSALPREAIAVEDSARGLKSAVSAGIDCIIVENEFTRTQDFSPAMAKVGSIRDLTVLLSGE
jgi:HAD superfamily hydrolase (TIGR01509 family)